MTRITNDDLATQVQQFQRRKTYAFPLLGDVHIQGAYDGFRFEDDKGNDLLGTGYTTKRKLYDALTAVNFLLASQGY